MSPALNSPRLTYVRSTDGRSAAVAQGRESSKETGGDDSKPRRAVAPKMYQRVQKHRINFNNLQNFSINPSPATSLEVSSLQADQVDRNEAAAAQNFP